MEALELRLGRVLRVGSLVSMALFAAGLAALFSGIDRRWSDAFVTAGLFILFGTPFTRVLVTTIEYWRRREWRFAIMTTVVLLVLVASVIVAMR
jgi:uncharacterized membrane protein